MAIAEMKKLTLLALKKDKMRLLTAMQRLGCVQVTQQDVQGQPDEKAAQRLEEILKDVARLDLTIARLSAFDSHKPGMLSLKPQAGEDQVATVTANRSQIMEIVERMEQIERTRGELRSRESREKAQIEQLTPWQDLTIPLEKIGPTATSHLMLVSVPQKNRDVFIAGLSQAGATWVQEMGQVRDSINMLLAVHQSVLEKTEELMREAGASRVQFEGVEGTPALAINQLHDKLARIEEVRAQLSEEVVKLAGNLPELRLLRDALAVQKEQLEAGQRCIDTQSAFLMTGWVPAHRMEKLEKALKKASPDCEVEFADPLPEEQPPVLLRNGKVTSPFETIVHMFGAPDPRGIDPTFVMMPFWVCFFGMMVSDAGYGVVLGLAAAFVWWKLKGKGLGRMAFILALGGLSTVIWGSIYGGWFGTTPYKPLLDPMNDALKVLIVCVVAGFVHILAGMLMSVYMSIKRGKPWDALFDQGFWIMILFGFALMVVNTTVGGIMAAAGAVGVILTGGRAKKGIIGKLIGGLGSLYGITGYLSDLLSYARLFGMGLATGVIGMVVNMLAGLLMGSPIGWVLAIIVLVGLHTFNLFINALGAYVHSCRLQFIEFFGKFYEAGGRNFVPLSNQTRYVDMAGEEN